MNPVADVMLTYVRCWWAKAREMSRDDRGSTSVEHILWYVAAGLGTVAVAAIIWTAIRAKASEPLPNPTAP
ncbi:MAG: hypothetical protein AB7V43_01110 [Acidimicrobiia bacterium]